MFPFFHSRTKRQAKTLDQVRAEVIALHNDIGSELAARYSRGNISIQEGAFLMEDDLRPRKRK